MEEFVPTTRRWYDKGKETLRDAGEWDTCQHPTHMTKGRGGFTLTGWDNAIVELEETGKVEKCPYCKSKAVDAEKIIGKRRDSYWFSCKNCGKSAHYSGELK